MVVLAAYAYSATRETRGTANMLIRNRRMGRERPGRRDRAIAPRREQARRKAPSSAASKDTSSGHLTLPHPTAAEAPRRDKPDVFQQVRLPDRNTSSHQQIGSFQQIVSRPRSLAPVASSESRSLRWARPDGIPPTTRCRPQRGSLFKFPANQRSG